MDLKMRKNRLYAPVIDSWHYVQSKCLFIIYICYISKHKKKNCNRQVMFNVRLNILLLFVISLGSHLYNNFCLYIFFNKKNENNFYLHFDLVLSSTISCNLFVVHAMLVSSNNVKPMKRYHATDD